MLTPSPPRPGNRPSLCEVLDRVLAQGVVARGEITLSLAGIDLVYLNLHLLLTTAGRLVELHRPEEHE